jgi:hypothetical protein
MEKTTHNTTTQREKEKKIQNSSERCQGKVAGNFVRFFHRFSRLSAASSRGQSLRFCVRQKIPTKKSSQGILL